MTEEIKQRIETIKAEKVPAGYKKTQFGVFPDDWVTDKTLGDIGVFGKGKGIPGNMLGTGNVPCVGYGDIYMKYNHFHFEEAQSFVDEETAKESTPIQNGTLLFTGTGETAEEIGKCVCYNGDETIYAGGDIITFNSKTVNSLFLAYQQYQDFSLKRKARFGQGNSVVHIQKGNLENLPVAYPVLADEQQQITEILLKWDKAIELQEKLIEKLELQKKALMQKIFIPTKQWDERTFKSLYNKAGEGGTPSTYVTKYYDGGNIPFIKIEHLCHKYIEEVDSYITKKGLENSGAWLLPENCILFSNGATIGEVAINKIPVATKQGILGIVPANDIDVEFLYYYFSTSYFLSLVASITTKGTMPIVYLKDLDKLKIKIPSYDMQQKISQYISLFDNEIALNKEKLKSLTQQQKAMQQLLLTGIVRV